MQVDAMLSFGLGLIAWLIVVLIIELVTKVISFLRMHLGKR